MTVEKKWACRGNAAGPFCAEAHGRFGVSELTLSHFHSDDLASQGGGMGSNEIASS